MLQLKAELQPAEYVELANMTVGYSGSDIAIAAEQACMEPLEPQVFQVTCLAIRVEYAMIVK